jgi:hypothetical protein
LLNRLPSILVEMCKFPRAKKIFAIKKKLDLSDFCHSVYTA